MPMTNPSFMNSDGWISKPPPSRIQACAPLIVTPAPSTSTRPSTPATYTNGPVRRSMRALMCAAPTIIPAARARLIRCRYR